MEVMRLLEYLQEIIETSHTMPFVNKTVINKTEVIDIIEQIINYIPEEFKKAQWICKEKERILNDAYKQSEQIKTESLEALKREIEKHSITREAQAKSEEIIATANRDAKTIRIGAKEYADEVLTHLESQISMKGEKMLITIKNETEEYLKATESNITSVIDTVRKNITELRESSK